MAAVLTHFFPGATSRFMGQRTATPSEAVTTPQTMLNTNMASSGSLDDKAGNCLEEAEMQDISDKSEPAQEDGDEVDEYQDSSEEEEPNSSLHKRTLRRPVRPEKRSRMRRASTDGDDSTSAVGDGSTSGSSDAAVSWQDDDAEEEDVASAEANPNLCM